MKTYGTESGIAIVAARVRDFRSLSNVEVDLGDLTLLIGANNVGKTSFLDALFAAIGSGRKQMTIDDIRIASGESAPPRTRDVIIDIMIRPIDSAGTVMDAYPTGSFWTGLWGSNGIAIDELSNEFTGLRTRMKWSPARGEHVIERRFLKEWKAFSDWTTAAVQDRPVSAIQMEPLALHYIDAKRDLDEELRKPGSFWRRLTDDLGLSEAEVAEMEKSLTDVNQKIVDKSQILQHLQSNLAELQTVVASDGGAVEVAPLARKLRDLAKGVGVSISQGGSQPFPLARHGMGTRSLAALLVFRAYASWRSQQATAGGDRAHSVLGLEEPEAHLHPQAQRSLYSHIQKVTGQRIVSTHSPYFAAQAALEDLRHFAKAGGDTVVRRLDLTKLNQEEIRKLADTVLETRGDILFSRGVVLFEGQTEAHALPVYALKYWGSTIHELGFCFVSVNGTDYFPYIWLAKSLCIPWYILSDGEALPVASLDGVLKKANESDSGSCSNVVVLPAGKCFESQLVAEGYLAEIERAIDTFEGQSKYLDDYINRMHGRPLKKTVTRDYLSEGGRDRAACDYLDQNKIRMAKPVAEAIAAHHVPNRRIPKFVVDLFEIVGNEHGLSRIVDEDVP